MNGFRRRKGVSPVIATIILSAVVLTIGGAVWNYSQGAATVIANDYTNETLSLLNEVIERYMIEHVSNSSDGSVLYVWIYNYGDVKVMIDIYANSTSSFNSTLGTEIESKELTLIEVDYATPLQKDDEVAIKAHSRRQNNEYYTYYIQ